jgi:tRNA pseudouridine55 synthase
MSGVAAADVAAAAAGFVGEIEQVPPMVSAIKVGGRRLHELARAGVEVERAPRPVTISRLVVEPTGAPLVYRVEVDCSSGTYIRSLAADLGRALGGGAHLRNLRRTRVGSFTLDEASSLEDLRLLPPAEALRGRDTLRVPAEAASVLARSGRLALEELPTPPEGPGPWAVLGPGGTLLAVAERDEAGRPRASVVLAGAPAG